MNSIRTFRPIASRLQASSLPRVSRSFSASASRSYDHIEVSEPKPGVGQGGWYLDMLPSCTSPQELLLTGRLPFRSDPPPAQGAERPVHAAH